MNIQNTSWVFRFVLFVLIVATFSVTMPAAADGNNALARSYSFLLQGDVVSSGVGLRGTGTGDIVVTEIPVGASVFRAILYWATLGGDDHFDTPKLNGESVNGTLIGTANDTIWNVSHNFVYRADVTTLVDGNGTYTISNLPDFLFGGNDSQGASLVVVYSDDSEPYRTIIFNDGAVALNFDTLTYTDTIAGFETDDPLSEAHVTYLVGDGQSEWDDGEVTFNGNIIAENVFTGDEGDYWDTLTFDITALSPTDPSTTMINDNDPGNPESPDALLWVATIFSVTRLEPDYDYHVYLPLLVH